MNYKASPRLKALFDIGYHHVCDDISNGDFNGPFVCTFLGTLFKLNNMPKPATFFMTCDGVHGFIGQDNTPHLFHKVLGTIIITAQGHKPVTLQRGKPPDISVTEIPASPPLENIPLRRRRHL